MNSSSFVGQLSYTREEAEELLAGAASMIPVAVKWYQDNHKGLFPPAVAAFKDHPFFTRKVDLKPFRGKMVIQSNEATTRTGGSFGEIGEALGLRVEKLLMGSGSRGVKGESPANDVEQIAQQGANVYVVRSSVEGEALFVAEMLQKFGYQIPVLNAGDGSHLHPSQGLLDWLTFRIFKGSVDGLTIGFGGDLRESRVLHSDLAFARAHGMKIVLVSFGGLKLQEPYREGLDIIAEGEGDLSLFQKCGCDIVVFLRVQRERIADQLAFDEIERKFVGNLRFLDGCKNDMILAHPGPCITEVDPEILRHPRVIISAQSWFGQPTRISLVVRALNEWVPIPTFQEGEVKFTEREIDATKAPERDKYYNPVDKGTVIDHVPAGISAKIIELLRKMGELRNDQHFRVAYNVPSPAVSGMKDVMLLPDGTISDRGAAMVTLMAPQATINILAGDGLLKKRKYQSPSSFRGVGRCLSPKCISNLDKECERRFFTHDHQAGCYWCDRSFDLKDILG